MHHLPLQTSSATGREGFTLIELLVVIGIIAVLMVLVLGGMRTLKERQEAAVCASNLRQMYLFMQIYAGEHDGYLPRALGAPRPNGSRPSWFNTLEEAGLFPVYGPEGWSGKERSVARCPAREDKAAHTKKIVPSAGYFHYGMNNCPGGLDTVSGPVKLVAIEAPSKTLLIADSDAQLWVGRIKGEPLKVNHVAYPHRDGVNLVFADGHGEWFHDPLPEITSGVNPPPFPWWGQ